MKPVNYLTLNSTKMIIDFILRIVTGFVNFLINLLPTSTIDSDIGAKITTFVSGVYAYNSVFPVDVAVNLMIAVLVFFGFIFTWRAFQYLIRLVRGN